MDVRFYPGATKNWDDERFRDAILAVLRPEDELLDLGAGAGIVAAMNFRGAAQRVCGIDLDPRVTENPFLDEGRVSDGSRIPYPDHSFDVVISDNVLEHLDEPLAVFREVSRVLRPGGRFLFKTPNATHYMPLIARCTPHAFHRAVNRLRGRNGDDTFPTRYRANSPRALRRLARGAGLDLVRVERVEHRPEYLRLHPLTYALGLAYERLVNLHEVFAPLRVVLLGEMQKPGVAIAIATATAAPDTVYARAA